MTAAPPPVTGRELSNPPTDGITNHRFSNLSDHLLVSSWDKVVFLSKFFLFNFCVTFVLIFLLFNRLFVCMMRVPMYYEESSNMVVLFLIAASMTIPQDLVPVLILLSGGNYFFFFKCVRFFFNETFGLGKHCSTVMMRTTFQWKIQIMINFPFFDLMETY